MPEVSPAGTRRIEVMTSSATSNALSAVKRRPYIINATIFGQSIHLLMDEAVPETQVRSDLNGDGFTDFEIRQIKPSLEDVFVTLTDALKEDSDEKR
jgi:ABC-2 type transport system ATP-binding protein